MAVTNSPGRSALAMLAVVLGISAGVATYPGTADAAPGNCPATAAELLGWGPPNRADDFESPSSLAGWKLYTGPGHAGNGRRTAAAASVADGALTITGDAQGDSAGMAWNPGQMYGRWEVCIKSPPASPNYHSVVLLWPDAEDWPVGGEIDFMEILDPDRQNVEVALHYGPEDRKELGNIAIDATQWHSWAVEWTPERIVTYVDGMQWWETTETTHFPPRPMHLCIQLDNFGGDISQGGQQIVDWVRQYAV